MEDVPLIELDSLEFGNDESWLVAAPSSSSTASSSSDFFRGSPPGLSVGIQPSSSLRKKTLIEKIDEIAQRTSYYASSNGYSSSPRQQRLCSTPVRNTSSTLYNSPILFKCPEMTTEGGGSNRVFDSRTFTRKAGARAERKLLSFSTEESSTPGENDTKLNLTFKKLDLNNSSSFEEEGRGPSSSSGRPGGFHSKEGGGLNRTYCAREEEEETNENEDVNLTYDATSLRHPHNENHNLNATFQMKGPPASSRKMSEDRLSSSPIPPPPLNGNMCLSREESSSHGELDDALSTTSDSSVSHRLNDVGDVQHIAKLQEESLKESPLVTTQQQPYARSATISPSSEHSPLTEEGNPLYYPPSEDDNVRGGNNVPPASAVGPPGGHQQHNNGRYQQYSSQDSLPDSPYSSQSLDSQPAPGQDRLRRSMPNLNKIRQNRGRGGGRELPAPPTMGGRPTNYGSVSGGHHPPSHRSSLATMYQHRSAAMGRGGVSTHQSASDSNLRNRSVSTTSAPRPGLMGPPSSSSVMRSTGIPRPGSRIPAPSGIPRSSGIPKPSSRLPTSSALRKTSYAGSSTHHRPGQYN